MYLDDLVMVNVYRADARYLRWCMQVGGGIERKEGREKRKIRKGQ